MILDRCQVFCSVLIVALAAVPEAGAQDYWLPLHDPGRPAKVVGYSPVDGFVAATSSSDFLPNGILARWEADERKWVQTIESPFTPFYLSLNHDDQLVMGGQFDESLYRGAIYTLEDEFTRVNRVALIEDHAVRSVIQTGPNRYFIGTSQGVLTSSDGGTSWQRVGPSHWEINTLDAAGGKLLAGTDDGLIEMDADGKWSRIGPEGLIIRDVLLLGEEAMLFVSDAGLHRVDYPGGIVENLGWTGAAPSSLTQDAGGTVWMGVLAARDSEEAGLHRSVNGGGTWTPVPEFVGRRVYALTSGEGTVVANTDISLATLPTAETAWIFSGIPDATVHQIRMAVDGRIIADASDIWSSTDSGETWEFLSENSRFFLRPDGWVLAYSTGRIDWYDLAGVHVKSVSTGNQEGAYWLLQDLSGRLFARRGDGKIAASEDAGMTWYDIEVPPGPRLDSGVTAPDGSTWFFGPAELWRSTDGGRTQDKAGFWDEVQELVITSDNLVLVVGNDLWRVDDYAQWVPIQHGFDCRMLQEILDGSLMAHCPAQGFSRSTDEGATWDFVYPSPDIRIESFAVDAEGRILVGSDGRSIVRSRLSVFDGATSIHVRPDEAGPTLNVFPNPASRLATVAYSVKQPAHVTIELFDVLGRRIGKTIGGFRGAGEYEDPIDLTGLPSGVYLYRAKIGMQSPSGVLVVTR